MKRLRTLQLLAAGMASFGLVTSPVVSPASAGQPQMGRPQAAGGAPQGPMIRDVSLDEEGVLTGYVLNRQGAPLVQTAVMVRSAGTIVAVSKTDAEGQFSVSNLRGGTYELVGAGSGGLYRVWTADASPPAATGQVMLVANETVVPEQADPPYMGQPGPGYNSQGGPGYNNYPYRGMQGARYPVTNGQVVMTGLYVAGFAGLITGIVIATSNLHEQESGS